MSKYIAKSLSAQLFCGVLLSLLAAAVTFVPCLLLGRFVLSRTVYTQSFSERMSDRKFYDLKSYVEREEITTKNLHRLNPWCRRGGKVDLWIYEGDTLLYDSPLPISSLRDPEVFDPNEEQSYPLTLSDGTAVRVFLRYYAGDAYYYWTVVASGFFSFGTFSLCFITFVHRKLRYVKQLKRELDVLSGGDLSCPVTVNGTDELGVLALGIDQMRRSILAHQSAEAQMRSANSQLVTAMSHDLRTPLTSLLAYLELMERGKYSGTEQLRHFISQSLGKALQIKNMADKLFEYFLVYSSEWEPVELESADADQVLQQFWGEYAFSLENEGFAVRTDFSPLNGRLQINLDLLRRAFDNLYSNISKYADPAQPVELAYFREGEHVRLTLLNRISPQRNRQESTNIGLSTCSRILQYHDGTFQAEEADGLFSVTVTLPLSEAGA